MGHKIKPEVVNLEKGQSLGVVWVSQGIILKYCQPRIKHKFIALSYQYAQIFLIALAML